MSSNLLGQLHSFTSFFPNTSFKISGGEHFGLKAKASNVFAQTEMWCIIQQQKTKVLSLSVNPVLIINNSNAEALQVKLVRGEVNLSKI